MRKLLFAVSALSLIALPAMAADLGPFYRAPIPVAVLGWTGPYVGATLGSAWTGSNVTEATGATFCNPALVGCAAGPAFSSALAAAIPRYLRHQRRGHHRG
jgi:opacity protein-like surface antigen